MSEAVPMRLQGVLNRGGLSRTTPAVSDEQIRCKCPRSAKEQTLADAAFTFDGSVSRYRCVNGCGRDLVTVRPEHGGYTYEVCTADGIFIDR